MNLNLYQQARVRRDEFRTLRQLAQKLEFVDGLAYGAYREFYGGWQFQHFDLFVNHVPPDHHGPPADFVVWVYPNEIGLPQDVQGPRLKRIASADFYLRRFLGLLGDQPAGSRGSGLSGLIDTDRPGQSIEERNACFFDGDAIELRLVVGLPSAGMTILVEEMQSMFDLLRSAVEQTFLPSAETLDALREHVRIAETQVRLREKAAQQGLVAFIVDQARLPRAGGGTDRPLDGAHVRPFESPAALAAELDLGGLGRFRGLGIPRGVTVITGGPYHGKSTLLSAIEEGTKNHIPGDGREFIVTDALTQRAEAEEGRIVRQVDLSPFLHDLPSHVAVESFSSEFASGSTSQAANIIEAIGAGARLLLIDEDRAATNLMFADEGMRALMKTDDLTLTSFLERVRELYEVHGVSSVIVAGSSSRYFSVADTVIKMEEYACRDITEEARRVAAEYHPEIPRPPSALHISRRVPNPPNEDLYRGRRFVECEADGRGFIDLEGHEIDLCRLSGVRNKGKLVAAGLAAAQIMRDHTDGRAPLGKILDELDERLDERGLLLLDPFRQHYLTRPDRFQIAAALNRLAMMTFVNS